MASALLRLTITERGRALSGQEDSYSRLVGTGCMSKETARRRSRVHLGVKLHKNLFCYPSLCEVLNKIARCVCSFNQTPSTVHSFPRIGINLYNIYD